MYQSVFRNQTFFFLLQRLENRKGQKKTKDRTEFCFEGPMEDDDSFRAERLFFSMEESDRKRRVSPKDPQGYYARLGVGTDATAQAIRHSFLTLSQAFHTDKHSDADTAMKQRMNQRFQEIQEAYDVLSDDLKRAAYDHSGAEGARRLELVPQHINRREDVLRVLDALQREADVRTTAKLLSASGSGTVTFSVAHLFASSGKRKRGRARRPEPSIAAFEGNQSPPTSNAEEESAAPVAPTTAAAEVAAAEPAQPVTPPAEAPPAAEGEATPTPTAKPLFGSPKEALANVKLVQIDGKETFVVLLPEEVQTKLRAALRGAQLQTSRSSQSPAGMGLLAGLLLALFPKKIAFQESFHHFVGKNVDIAFKGEVESGAQKTEVSVSTTVKYVRDGITSYAASVKIGLTKLSCWVQHQRHLTPLWYLRSRLSVLEKNSFLNKLKLTLVRKLSSVTELTNAVTWSVAGGSFETSIVQAVSNTNYSGVQTSLSAGSASVGLFRSRSCAPLAKLWNSDMPGRVQQTVNFDPFSGRTNVQYELWLHYSRLCHVGVGISSLLPVALHPTTLVTFSDDLNNMCQVHLMYARGDHRISIPIIVFASKSVTRGLLWLVVPYTVYRVGGVLLRPLWLVSQARTVSAKRHAVRSAVLEARDAAQQEQSSIAKYAERSRVVEDAVAGGGLVIVNAKYGVLFPEVPQLATESTYPLEWDVTVVLQNMVQSSSLSLPEGPKANLAGFYDVDPATSEKRHIRVVYWYRRVRHSVTVEEHEAVQLPQESHREAN